MLELKKLSPQIELGSGGRRHLAPPTSRLGRPEELYLAGDAAPLTTGADIVSDGGFTCA